MSDYLWDKTGEREEEVERLETLLGELRYKPRPLELSSEVEASATHATRPLRTPHVFRPAGFAAVAAALLLAFVAAALVLLRTNTTGGGRQSAAQTTQESLSGDQQQNPAPRATAPPRQEPTKDAHEPEKRDVQDVVNNVPQDQERRKERLLAGVSKRQREQTPSVVPAGEKRDVSLEQMSVRESLDGVALKMRLLAKEQLVYALRLTSSKLREVRKKTQGEDEPARAFDGRKHFK